MDAPVLLTGGSGFLGSHVADLLARQGVETRALVRPTSDCRHLAALPGVSLVHGSLLDPDSLLRAVRGVRTVIHAAALVKARRPEEFTRVNTEGTAHLFAAVRAGAPGLSRFVHVSSLTALGPSTDGRPRPQDAPPVPLTPYGRSKLAAEEVVRRASGDVFTVTIRPPIIHGPRDRETLKFFRAVKLGVFPMTGPPESVLSMVYATDCAQACLRALIADVPSGSVFDVEDGKPETLGAIIGHIETALGRRARLRVPIPGPVLGLVALGGEAFGRLSGKAVMLTRAKVRELRAPHWVCDAAAARSFLGWAPEVPFAEGARRSVAWYRDAGWL